MLIDPQPDVRGNIRLDLDDQGAIVATIALDRPAGVTLYRSHFITCPDRDLWRKR